MIASSMRHLLRREIQTFEINWYIMFKLFFVKNLYNFNVGGKKSFFLPFISEKVCVGYRGVFRTHANDYDGTFLRTFEEKTS